MLLFYVRSKASTSRIFIEKIEVVQLLGFPTTPTVYTMALMTNHAALAV